MRPDTETVTDTNTNTDPDMDQRRYARVIGVTNEMATCLYISIGNTSLNFLNTAPQPISDKRRMYVLLLLLSFI